MNTKFSDGYSGFTHLVERQMLFHGEMEKLLRERVQESAAYAYRFITISRDVGSMGEEIASGLASRLQWKVYDREVVDYIAKHNHVIDSIVSRMDEKTQSRIHDGIERLLLMFHGQGFNSDAYHISLIQALAALAGQGDCIILGHGGSFALQEYHGLHVKITASFPVRVQRVRSKYDITTEKAEKTVQKTDRNRAEFIQHHFMVDRNCQNYYHMIFNTDRCTIDNVISGILGYMRQRIRPGAAMKEQIPVLLS